MELKEHRYQASKEIVHILRKGHPWIHRNALSSAIAAVPPASILRIVDGENKFVTHAVYEPHGSIAFRNLFTREPFSVGQFRRRIQVLAGKKKQAAGGALRLINGEGDHFAGLTCDLYGSLRVWQPYLSFWDQVLPALAEEADSLLGEGPHLVRLPSHRGGGHYMLKGEEPSEPVTFMEHGLRLCSWPATGQKSGFFLDLKEVRTLLPRLVRGGRVLNCFASTGAFSLISRKGGAREILSIDSDRKCQEMAARQMESNGYRPGEIGEWRVEDVFEELPKMAATGERFGLVILDPPNMSTKKASLKPALKGWEKLLRMGQAVMEPEGRMVAVNCSGFMTRELCEGTAKGLGLKISATGGLPEDHTVRKNFPEGNYLKWWVYKAR